ncbi:MAG: hypothetical protein QFE16_03355 [Pseudomonadota bacterium]|nr:hypothetical protein [Pseudomonadota bacterium]
MRHHASISEAWRQQRLVVQLVAPGTGGVRDYLECLQRQWQSMGITSHVIALSPGDARQQSLGDRLQVLVEAHRQPCSLVLHFSGYGFEQRGLCFWLVREIENARKLLGENLRLVTMFHELFASGPPWGSAFWLSRVQASIASRIARASDGLWTNTELHGHWLRKQVGEEVPIQVQPVFSTVGEPDAVPDTNVRAPRVAVFGSQSTRHRALARLPPLAAHLRSAGITEVVEVGSGAAYPWHERSLKMRFLGRLETSELRSVLESSAYGLLDYPPQYLGKSTVFAAYAAHGCVSLNTADTARDTDGLKQGLHFVMLKSEPSIPKDFLARRAVADAGRAWYSRHSLALQAQTFAESCGVTNIACVDHA